MAHFCDVAKNFDTMDQLLSFVSQKKLISTFQTQVIFDILRKETKQRAFLFRVAHEDSNRTF